MTNCNINIINEFSLKLILILFNLSFKSILILLFVVFINRVFKDVHGKIKQVFIFLCITSIFCLPLFYNVSIKILNLFYTRFPQLIIFNPVFRTLRSFNYGLIDTAFSKQNNSLFSNSLDIQVSGLSWTFYLFMIWLIGFGFYLAVFFINKILIIKIIKKSQQVKDKRILNKLNMIYKRLNLKSRIKVYSSSNCNVPLTYWFFKNYIILPNDFL